MSQPLTLEHFDETMGAIAATLGTHGEILNDHTRRFDAIDATLADHTARLERLEKLLDLEQRFERFEADTRARFRKVGEHLGMADVGAG